MYGPNNPYPFRFTDKTRPIKPPIASNTFDSFLPADKVSNMKKLEAAEQKGMLGSKFKKAVKAVGKEGKTSEELREFVKVKKDEGGVKGLVRKLTTRK
jgi:hypothetical protein